MPGKNIKPLGGVPLIGWSINIAKQLDRVSRIIVSTDSEEISTIAKEFGAEVPFVRPEHLARDDSSEWLTWRHAVDYMRDNDEEAESVVVLPATSPLRSVDDVNSCIDAFEDSEADVVITVSKATRSPYFNMVMNDKDGYASLVVSPKDKITRRQDSPEVYDMTTVAYVVSANFIQNNNGIFDGRVKSVDIPRERAVDIDDLMDFKIAELMLENGHD